MQQGFYECCSKQLTIALRKEDSGSYLVIEQVGGKSVRCCNKLQKQQPNQNQPHAIHQIQQSLVSQLNGSWGIRNEQKNTAPHTLKSKDKVISNPENKHSTEKHKNQKTQQNRHYFHVQPFQPTNPAESNRWPSFPSPDPSLA